MDSKDNKLGTAGAVGFALAVFGFIALLVTISMLGPFIPKIIRIVGGIVNQFLMKDKVTYKDSGVDIAEGDKFVQSIQPYIKKTLNKNIVGTTTSFAALFSIDNKKYQKPLLVACTDGVGSKIEIGIRTNKIKGLGIDLVAI